MKFKGNLYNEVHITTKISNSGLNIFIDKKLKLTITNVAIMELYIRGKYDLFYSYPEEILKIKRDTNNI